MKSLEAGRPAGEACGGGPALKRKRPLEEGNGAHVCQLQVLWQRLSWSVAPKNALVQLHELRPGLQYRTVSQTGPVHAPVFAVAVEVNGLTFEGTGPTKKKAKMRAAELALKSFVQFPNSCQAQLALGSTTSPCPDFTSDQADFPDTLFKEFEPSEPRGDLLGCRPTAPELLPTACPRSRLLCRTLDLLGPTRPPVGGLGTGERNPVVVLSQLRSGLRYVCLSETAPRQRPRSFVMAVCVDGSTFEGSGRSKKLARGQAAMAALHALFNIRLPGPGPSGSRSRLLPQVSPEQSGRASPAERGQGGQLSGRERDQHPQEDRVQEGERRRLWGYNPVLPLSPSEHGQWQPGAPESPISPLWFCRCPSLAPVSWGGGTHSPAVHT